MCSVELHLAMSNTLLGYWGKDAAETLATCGVRPQWADRYVAFGGAPVFTEHTKTVVVSGELVLDNAAALARHFEEEVRAPGTLVAALYRCHGDDTWSLLEGMFALAVWDSRAQVLTLVRDGVGARTLYLAETTAGRWFALRTRTLLRCPGVSQALSLPALRNYLTCAYVPGAETLRRDIEEMRPGEERKLPGNTRRTWWEPRERDTDPDLPISVYAARLRPLLERAVEDRLPVSGPVGVFLSGGLDSSLVTALAARAAPGPVHTFAVHFGPDYPNELVFSEQVARHCGAEHHLLELPGRVIRDSLEETMAALDDPIGDPLTTPNLLLARMAAGYAPIVLNGEGGDPCFGGPKNLPMLLHTLYGDTPLETAYFRSYQKCFDDLSALLTPEAQEALRAEPPQAQLLSDFFQDARASPLLNRLMRINVLLKGADHILTKVNNLTSVAAVLGRSPLFDRRIVTEAFQIPSRHKLTGSTEKAVLKAAVADLLPAAILNRPKSGMLVPVQGWFRRDLRRYSAGLLLGRRARIRPYLNQQLLRQWLSYRGNLWPRHGVKLWLVLSLEVWLRAHE